MGAGTVVLVTVEDLDFIYSFYCVVGTITSLGYIDKCFSTEESTEEISELGSYKRKTTLADLEAVDVDDDGVVVQEDMAPIMEEFERLDFDKTGTLTASDVLLSQSSWYAADILLTQTSV
ncbi:two pore domain potassium channel, EF-hand domain pair [Artemisia annua]|uniref:Two pore domain potassium channel, EF-hand domain pair n=1 Tax=Artemisia annua TaxID=35608 RepID=A0A2U1NN21_ARTAN|nr:two pore domain potassium channel, EF-hand domain pair [Artemisia annua]